MLRYQSGDEGAFAELYRRYNQRVYAYLSRRLNERDWRDDVFQMVFTKLHRTRHQYDPTYRFDQWIFVMTKTVLLDFWKTTGQTTQRYYSAHGEVPETQSQISESNSEISLEGLTSDQKTALKLRFFDDLSYGEIAGRLGRSEPTVRQIVSRALRKLRGSLRKSEEGE